MAAGVTISSMTPDDEFFIAEHDYGKDETILNLGNHPTTKEDKRRIQVNKAKYILPPVLLYHSCRPNAYICWEDMTLRAFTKISKNELVTYHYGTSEYDYSIGAFACNCGSENCIKYFSGFKNMNLEQQQAIFDNSSDYIKSLRKSET